MKRRERLSVEQLEARDTPSQVILAVAPLDPALTPGVTRGGWSPDGAPAPVQVRDGFLNFTLTGVTR